MDRDKNIIELVENYADEIRKYCNGIDSIIKQTESFDLGELNFREIHFNIIQELNKYFRKSRNDKQNIVLPKLKDIFNDLVYEYENTTLIHESLFKDHIVNNNDFIEEKYKSCKHINDTITDLSDLVEIEIEQREKRTDSHGRIDPRIDSSHCIDINTRFVIALFEEILKNPGEIENLKNSKKAVLLEKLTGHKRKTFANNYSKGGKVSEAHTNDAKKLIESLMVD